jgi:hypothetical protein
VVSLGYNYATIYLFLDSIKEVFLRDTLNKKHYKYVAFCQEKPSATVVFEASL